LKIEIERFYRGLRENYQKKYNEYFKILETNGLIFKIIYCYNLLIYLKAEFND